ncbi:hypothetical protein M409DRAFT_16429 [Zasmidium cellare ATCC 36951]|uniref:F-box domain-containing protein n=1 Tax=Zasmidium cellare ATCC 36951 TaxID=1080233 RepID=A0A6A6D422_ZASCE|nr:uncharacterized protein M409DRAFT_16429 [Zasmidium cellare ATCC 36951]KAF2174161.1 hypothetical protein M409DRAFT_16429 [Zasmidium cellare ATCC 36951]
MVANPNPSTCQFLTLLPREVRDIIYEHILTFPRPLKLRQVVAGSKNTAILRLNRQIASEALPIFYDANTILATRNDFCSDTGPELQTPLRKDRVRHLLIRNFSQSIRCSSFSGGNNLFLEGCCDVCKPNAAGFIAALGSLPRLRTVVVDYHNHYREFEFIKQTIRGIGSTHVEAEHGFALTCTHIARYRLSSPSLPPNLDITFTDLPLHTIWSELWTLRGTNKCPFPLPGEEALLQRLREDEHPYLPDQLNHIIYARHSRLHQPVGEVWTEYEAKSSSNSSEAMNTLTEMILGYLHANRQVSSWRTLTALARSAEAKAYEAEGREVPEEYRT